MREKYSQNALVTRSFTSADDRELRRMTRSLFSYPRTPDMVQELMGQTQGNYATDGSSARGSVGTMEERSVVLPL
jgi:hypothetical protein